MDSSGPQEKKAVPRFASFKPPVPPPAAGLPTQLPKRESAHRETSKHHSKHQPRHRSHRDGRSRSRERRRKHRLSHREPGQSKERHAAEQTTAPESVVTEPEDSSDLYVIDRKGDKYNLIYGTIHRYNVPHYYRYGRGRVLGLPSNYRIDRDTIGENEIVVQPETWRTDYSKSKSKSLLSGLDKHPTRLLRVRSSAALDAQVNISEDYIPLSVSQSRRQYQGILETSDPEDEKYAYRSIHGKLKDEEGLADDLELISESSDDEDTRTDPDAAIKQHNAELSRNVEKRPTDVSAWIQLIDHQETVLRGSAKDSTLLTNAEQKSLADIKLSLYEKALKKVGEHPSRDRLLLGLLEEGAKLWDTKKLSERWQTILKSNSHFINLWIKYLDFRQTEFLNFTYHRCLATFLECLSLNKATRDSPEKTQVQMYLFLRLTLFLRETGYTELATGLWQAILEWSFFRPDDLGPNKSSGILAAFADFWDSEVPRIGEVGAKGWKNGKGAFSDPKVFNPEFQLNPKSILPSWVKCEQEHILNAQLPARSIDEPEDDPFRVVLSSDLEQLLPLVGSPNLGQELIDSFVYFCQLPPIISDHNLTTTGYWMGDSFLRNDLITMPYITLSDWLPGPVASAEPGAPSPVVFPHQHFIPTFDTYFASTKSWFYSFKAWLKATSDPTSTSIRDWTRKVLRLLVEAIPGSNGLAEYAVALEFSCNPKEAKKYAKALLKKRSSSLRLYNTYAFMERQTGNQETAAHIWATAISMSKSFPDSDRVDSILLWRTWIWELLEDRNIAHAIHLLMAMPQNHIDIKTFPDASSKPEFSPANLLKIQSHVSGTLESALIGRRSDIIIACTECRAFLTYLAHTQDLSRSMEAYGSTISKLTSLPESADSFKSFTLELLHQARAKLVYYHQRTSSLYKPTFIRSILEESMTLHPHNTIFLSLFSWNESRFRIEERVRDTMREITTTSRIRDGSTTTTRIPITSYLFSIYTELSRPVFAGSTHHSSRAAFEKALSEQQDTSRSSNNTNNPGSTAHSSLSLWKLYILFELSRKDIRRAKDVFYRAMRACPWSKDLLMLAFTHLRADIIREQYADTLGGDTGMDFPELHRVYNVLVEKELRVHVDIERELDDLAGQIQGEGGAALGIPIIIPDDANSEDEQMQM